MIPLAVAFKAYAPTYVPEFGKTVTLFTWPIMKPWQNLEDGIVAGEEYLDKPEWFRILYWNCIRNPANGLRFIPLLAPIPEPSKIRFIASFLRDEPLAQEQLYNLEEHDTFWYFVWQGPYAGFRWQFIMPFTVKIPFTKYGFNKGELIRIWIGTKFYPSNVYKVYEYQKWGVGTTFQIKDVTRFEII